MYFCIVALSISRLHLYIPNDLKEFYHHRNPLRFIITNLPSRKLWVTCQFPESELVNCKG